ncbi:MAG TPA: type II secretion system protein GspM [Hyphomicrobiales bacterium]|nr:type II secretion system protein GspM [Hyphomicrobiales bacterium]
MNRRERQLVLVAALVFALVLAVRIVPGIAQYYRQGRDDVALLQERIDRYRALSEATAEWQERQQQKTLEVADLQAWVFSGSDANLVGNNVQRSLRVAVEKAGLEVREMNVAKYSYTGDWLMVTQEMSFTLDQNDILPFLTALQEMRPRLFVQGFTINRTRRQYSGNIVVAGFAPAAMSGR